MYVGGLQKQALGKVIDDCTMMCISMVVLEFSLISEVVKAEVKVYPQSQKGLLLCGSMEKPSVKISLCFDGEKENSSPP